MGIARQLAICLLREHAYRPIEGSALSIGRQAVHLTPQEALALVEMEAKTIRSVEPRQIKLDSDTRTSAGPRIADDAFFSLFSDASYDCLDVSSYEGANIVADLTQSLPVGLDARFDFILDGGTLDNIFDPAAAIRNISLMLRPGGRVVHHVRASRDHNVYVAFALSWFHDFYAINDYADCQVYLIQWNDRLHGRWDFFHYEPVREENGELFYFGQDRWYNSSTPSHVLVLAEKGAASTSHRTPVQFEYRNTTRHVMENGQREIAWQKCSPATEPYLRAATRFFHSKRPLLLRENEVLDLPLDTIGFDRQVRYCGSLMPR
jgi:SAM-dependent methyltransferase